MYPCDDPECYVDCQYCAGLILCSPRCFSFNVHLQCPRQYAVGAPACRHHVTLHGKLPATAIADRLLQNVRPMRQHPAAFFKMGDMEASSPTAICTACRFNRHLLTFHPGRFEPPSLCLSKIQSHRLIPNPFSISCKYDTCRTRSPSEEISIQRLSLL